MKIFAAVFGFMLVAAANAVATELNGADAARQALDAGRAAAAQAPAPALQAVAPAPTPASLGAQAKQILQQISNLRYDTCSNVTYYDDGDVEDDGCNVGPSYDKPTVDNQVKIALNLLDGLLANGQFDVATEAVKGITAHAGGYPSGGTMASGEQLYDRGQVDQLIDMALKLLSAGKAAQSAQSAGR